MKTDIPPVYEQRWTDDGGKRNLVVNYDLEDTTRVTREAMQLLLSKAGFEIISETPFIEAKKANA